MPPRKRAPRKPTNRVEEELVIPEPPVPVEIPDVLEVPEVESSESPSGEIPPEPSSPVDEQIKDMLIMRQMQYTMLEQSRMIRTLQQRLGDMEGGNKVEETVVQVEEEQKEEEVDMGWPSPDVKEDGGADEDGETDEDDDPLSYRREKKDRKFEDVYATDGPYDNDKNITLTDAASGTWGSMSQTASHVGLRTRSLFLNPTLQQPSIGGLI
jgi:hypothetical protein